MTVDYEDVQSSNIRRIGWSRGIAYVEFHGGRRFAYEAPKMVFDEMKAAKSVGTFFGKNIKGACRVVWQGWGCDASPCQEDAAVVGEVAGQAFRLCQACSAKGMYADIKFELIPPPTPPKGK